MLLHSLLRYQRGFGWGIWRHWQWLSTRSSLMWSSTGYHHNYRHLHLMANITTGIFTWWQTVWCWCLLDNKHTCTNKCFCFVLFFWEVFVSVYILFFNVRTQINPLSVLELNTIWKVVQQITYQQNWFQMTEWAVFWMLPNIWNMKLLISITSKTMMWSYITCLKLLSSDS